MYGAKRQLFQVGDGIGGLFPEKKGYLFRFVFGIVFLVFLVPFLVPLWFAFCDLLNFFSATSLIKGF